MKFMVSTAFRGSTEERNALIPQEQAHIRALREKGIVEALYISADHPYVWIVMQGESKEFIQQTLQSLPLYPYMQPEITPLM
ncbi:MAG: muconolactone Delta-isomerase family protein [Ktedonobacteraceae bacterium]